MFDVTERKKKALSAKAFHEQSRLIYKWFQKSCV